MRDGSGIDGGFEIKHLHKKCAEKLDKEVNNFVNKKLL